MVDPTTIGSVRVVARKLGDFENDGRTKLRYAQAGNETMAVAPTPFLQTWTPTVAVWATAMVAWFKYVQGRVFIARIEPSIEGMFHVLGDGTALIVSVNVKNIGLCNIDLVPDGRHFLVKIWDVEPETGVPRAPREVGVTAVFNIFEGEERIEAGEFITEDTLVLLPDRESYAISLELDFTARKSGIELKLESWLRPTWGAAAFGRGSNPNRTWLVRKTVCFSPEPNRHA